MSGGRRLRHPSWCGRSDGLCAPSTTNECDEHIHNSDPSRVPIRLPFEFCGELDVHLERPRVALVALNRVDSWGVGGRRVVADDLVVLDVPADVVSMTADEAIRLGEALTRTGHQLRQALTPARRRQAASLAAWRAAGVLLPDAGKKKTRSKVVGHGGRVDTHGGAA